jgi:hypothetical protein
MKSKIYITFHWQIFMKIWISWFTTYSVVRIGPTQNNKQQVSLINQINTDEKKTK